MARNNNNNALLIVVAVIALVAIAFAITNSTGNVTGNQVATRGDVGVASANGATNFGSLEVTEFSALLNGDRYSCNREGIIAEGAVDCETVSQCPRGATHCSSNLGICLTCDGHPTQPECAPTPQGVAVAEIVRNDAGQVLGIATVGTEPPVVSEANVKKCNRDGECFYCLDHKGEDNWGKDGSCPTTLSPA